MNALEFCLFGRKLSKLYSKVNVADVIHVKFGAYETVKLFVCSYETVYSGRFGTTIYV